MSNLGYLELCIGPMFAGKTTYLLDLINNLNINKFKFIVIKPIIDVRYNENMITSHDKISYSCISMNILNEIFLLDLDNIDYILIEEAQFFTDLFDTTIKLLNLNKKIFIAGLNGDYKMKPFGDIHKLISLADNIIYKHAICACSKPASFTSRISSNSDQIVIGGSESYIPTCRLYYR